MENASEWRAFFPALMALLFTFISPILLPVGLQSIAPLLGFSVMFYTLRRGQPGQMPIGVVLLCGLLLDMLQAMPLGVGISATLLVHFMARRRGEESTDEKRNFLRNALRHSWIMAAALLWIYLLMSLTAGAFYPPLAPLLQWLATVVSYPLIYMLCHAIQYRMTPSRPSFRS